MRDSEYKSDYKVLITCQNKLNLTYWYNLEVQKQMDLNEWKKAQGRINTSGMILPGRTLRSIQIKLNIYKQDWWELLRMVPWKITTGGPIHYPAQLRRQFFPLPIESVPILVI